MSELAAKIRETIDREGPVPFESFMEMALYHPGLGYYTREDAAIGREGDYYTSPHLHPLFGAMLGRQLEEMWEVMGRPEDFRVVEMGAGVGWMAKDLLDYLRGKDIPREILGSMTYTIVELNPALRERQAGILGSLKDWVEWVPGIDAMGPLTGCFISNELLDAFPVRVVEMDDELKEIYVAVRGDSFYEVKVPAGAAIRDYLHSFGVHLPQGYRTEVNLRIRKWLRQVSSRLAEGFILTVDYGYPASHYYNDDRNRGTLLCYHRHQVGEDPYRYVGEQDITAHVNFSSLKRWGDELGLTTLGYCSQGTYLISLGIEDAIKELYGEMPDAYDLAKIKGLILPQGMGESHKVMVQYRGEGSPNMRGYMLRNQLNRL